MKWNLLVIITTISCLLSPSFALTKLYVPAGATGDPAHTETIVYGIETGKIITTIQPTHDAGLAALSADSSEVWLFGAHSTFCDIVNTSTDKIVKTIDLERQALEAAFTPDGKYCLVIGTPVEGNVSRIVVIERSTYSVNYPIADVSDPRAFAVTKDSKSFYCASRSQGTVSKISIPSFKIEKTIHVGYEPIDLVLSNDGKFLFAVCQGLQEGRRGGSVIAVVSTITDSLFWVLDNIGSSPTSLSVNNDASRIVVTYFHPQVRPVENIGTYQMQITADTLMLTRGAAFSLGEAPDHGFLTSTGRYWIGCDEMAGGILSIDLSADSVMRIKDVFGRIHPRGAAAVALNIDQKLAELQAKIAAQTDQTQIPDYYIDMAYLLKTGDRKNDMVAAYQKVVDQYPQSFAGISAGMQLADICFSDQLFSKSAEYSYNSLDSYRRYLTEYKGGRYLQISQMLTAVDRLADFSAQQQKDLLKNVADAYLKVTVKRPELAETLFRLGYHLRKQDESKLANRCFAEVQNQLDGIEDQAENRLLSARLQLASGDPRAFYKIKNSKKEILVDGDLSEWQKEKPVSFSSTSGFTYGTAPWKGTSDLSGSVTILTSPTDVYISGVINDDQLLSIDEGHSDAVALYFDFHPDAGSYFTRNFDWGDGCTKVVIAAPDATNPKARLKLEIPATYEIASARTDSGYTFEVKVPINVFGGWLRPETKRIGLGIELIDYDAADDPKQAKAMGFLMPTPSPGEPPRAELLGVAEF